MRRLFCTRTAPKAVKIAGTFCLAMAMAALHAAAGPVEYTWTLAALGQGGWIGGPLFEGGSVGGGGALSAANGGLIARFEPTTWSEDANEEITVCFGIHLGGPSGSASSHDLRWSR